MTFPRTVGSMLHYLGILKNEWRLKFFQFRKVSANQISFLFLFVVISTSASATASDVAWFESQTNTLMLPRVSLSEAGFTSMELQITETAPDLILTLNNSEELNGTGESIAYYSSDTGLLNIPQLQVGEDFWMLTLQQISDTTQFSVASAAPSPRVSILEIEDSETIPYVFAFGNEYAIPSLDSNGTLRGIDYLKSETELISFRFDAIGNLERIKFPNFEASYAYSFGVWFSLSGNGTSSSAWTTGEELNTYLAQNVDPLETEFLRQIILEFNQLSQEEDLLSSVDSEWDKVVTQISESLPSDDRLFPLLKAATLATSIYACSLSLEDAPYRLSCESALQSYASLISKNDAEHNARFAAAIGLEAIQCFYVDGSNSCVDLNNLTFFGIVFWNESSSLEGSCTYAGNDPNAMYTDCYSNSDGQNTDYE
ncbi:MAG: hypothetical protein GKR91_05175 [Pseudomonadales bacterium]|nr:hypothetical protein [Pseudomonadales bacterium]